MTSRGFSMRVSYAEHYARELPVPCDGCRPLYKAGYKALLEAVDRENFGDAYELAKELSRMWESEEMCSSEE